MLVNGPRWTRCCRAMLNSVHSVSRGTVGVRRTLLHPGSPATTGTSYRGKKDDTRLFTPIPIRPSPDDINVGAELTGALDKAEMLKVILKFSNRKEIKFLCLENGIDSNLQQQAFVSFRKYCLDTDALPADLHVVLSDILQGAGHVDDIFPYFLRHVKQIFPHLECMDDLKKISDLRQPANWYPSARGMNRKVIFHSGPTNSGKTYHAMERFLAAKSGVYCGPLKLLASEVYNKSNQRGTACDLVTGEERKFANPEGKPSAHVACTVEMTSINTPYEVAVIDEIQLLKDVGRGWAWTRAFLGLMAEEIHPTMNQKGEKEMDTISVSAALQIAGRAGRYGMKWEEGYVTTFKAEDLPTLKGILGQTPDPLTQAGLHPTADMIELYAYHLPNATLSNLMEIFVSLSTVDDSLYFMCNTEDFKFLAETIQHVPLPLRARYIFCCAPINRNMPFVCSMFLKYARRYSRNEPVTFDWLCNQCGWPFQLPRTIIDLVHLEAVFDVLDLYLWLSYRFPDLFPDEKLVRDIQRELDDIIQQGVFQITKLLKNSETAVSTNTPDEDSFVMRQKKSKYYREAGAGAGGTRGRLTERLLAQGLLTPAMLQELKQEWDQQAKRTGKGGGGADDEDDPFDGGKKGPGRRKGSRKMK
uniref:ATP-dependent RNA helicase SUV3 homolog, mitochondrial n=1 Tax=Anopheles coluzzii TaxID=1518534 RepID=A0A8W7PBW6_ANOCL